MCGENTGGLHLFSCRSGSPPRVRGKPSTMYRYATINGITPACAGKTLCRQEFIYAYKDHPRVCGENFCPFAPAAPFQGSPPRVRGKRGGARGTLRLQGITPACAGKTCRSAITVTRPKDHPRVCGENAGIVSASISSKGSPPRVRGKRSGWDF